MSPCTAQSLCSASLVVSSCMRQLHRRHSRCPLAFASLRFFDIETTGLRPDRGAKITEMAVAWQGRVRYAWARSEKAEVEQAGAAPAVTPGGHLRESDPLMTALPRVLRFLCDGVVVGHNLSFDFRFLTHEAERRGLPVPALQFIDTLSLARRVLEPGADACLDALLSRFDISTGGPLHTATVDARATEALFWTLCEAYGLETLADAGAKPLRW